MTPNITKDDRTKGKYMLRWWEPSESGKLKHKIKRGFNTKRDAMDFFVKYCNERGFDNDSEKKPEDMQFSELAAEWLVYERNRIKGSSYATMESRVNSQLLPAFGEMKIKDITPIVVLRWQENLEGSFEYRKNVRARLSSIFRYAAKYHDIINVMDKVDGLRNLEPKHEMSFWTPKQFAAFYDHCSNEMYRLYYATLYILGCRKGELQALVWGDIDFDKCDVHISHTVTNKIAGETWTVTTPKTRTSDRHVRIPEEWSRTLKEYKERTGGSDTDFCFGKTRPLPPQSIDYNFTKIAEAAGLPKIRVHDLRHSCASLLISKGIDIVAVSKILGHSSVKQTLDTYSHMMTSSEDRAVAVYADFIDSDLKNGVQSGVQKPVKK